MLRLARLQFRSLLLPYLNPRPRCWRSRRCYSRAISSTVCAAGQISDRNHECAARKISKVKGVRYRCWVSSKVSGTVVWLRQRPFIQQHLAAGIPHGRPEVLAMDPHQPLTGNQPQPEEKRHFSLDQVVRQSSENPWVAAGRAPDCATLARHGSRRRVGHCRRRRVTAPGRWPVPRSPSHGRSTCKRGGC